MYATFVILGGISCIAFFFYLIPFYTREQVYNCVWEGKPPDNPEEVCVASNICKGENSITSWSINWKDKNSIHNWQDKLNLMCEPKWKIALIGSMFFVGWCCSLLWVPRLADVYGRKRLFILGMLWDLVTFTVIMFTNSLNVMIAAYAALGFNSSIRINIGWVYLMELMPKKGQALTGTIWFVFEASVVLWATLYFSQSQSRNWIYCSLVGYCLQIIAFFGSFILPESPKFLIEQNR